ncbi:alkaline phosphatase D family protein [Parahaliea mediterranea]|uniref:Alkaline phosphatase D family protein n=1 Tax=Parahaliea mediterranea TaxID=651086 RepID=A0A939DDD9_9GAMM|nr:alkaline phosphatase D family protein [Parahaliea mediterranea]MBN7796190.1 alkaline phosphatase D family protein [Parahaliea mediterranea]
MAKLKRRDLLRALGAAGAAAPAAYAAPLTLHGGEGRFLHGVASGDPGAHDVVLWTRVTPAGDAGGGDIAVDLEVADDPGFREGRRLVPGLRAVAARDYTLKHVLNNLEPGRDYYYRFHCRGASSTTGRTRTLAVGPIDKLRLAVASCALWTSGYFHAYEAIASGQDLDAVIHLGDYIYEYGAAAGDYGMHIGAEIGRIPEPAHRLATLADYRTRHAQYKRDEQLQRAHACAPWITVWDDHEVANNSWHSGDDTTADAGGEGAAAWDAKKVAALRAYYEWMPIREPLPNDRRSAACRAFRFGDLAELLMVESRLTGRDRPLEYGKHLSWQGDKPDVATFNRQLLDPGREMLGRWQDDWLARSLSQSVAAGVRWQVLGNQVLMARIAAPSVKAAMPEATWNSLLAGLSKGQRDRVVRNEILSAYDIPSNLDAWDGYPAARTRVYKAIRQANARVVALAGDTHMAWANELWDDSGRHRVAVEFATTSVTSPSYGDYLPDAPIGRAMAERNPEVIYNDPKSKGYLLVELRREDVSASYVTLSSVVSRQYTARVDKAFRAVREDAANPGQVGGLRPLPA